MKNISYKGIIENMVRTEVINYVEKKSGKYAFVVDGSLKLENTDHDLGSPSFDIEVKVDDNKYAVSGYVSEYGMVHPCCVKFDRNICRKKDENGEWIIESAERVHEFLYRETLAEFKFDR